MSSSYIYISRIHKSPLILFASKHTAKAAFLFLWLGDFFFGFQLLIFFAPEQPP